MDGERPAQFAREGDRCRRFRRRLALALLAAATALLAALPFLRAAGYGFVNCDDYDYALVHREVTSGLSPESAMWAFGSLSGCIWMPLTWLSYMADHTFFGGSPGAMHLHSVVVHGLNAGLFFVLLVLLPCRVRPTGADRAPAGAAAAMLAALVWAVHPLRCESVAWIASRKDVLSLFWELLALVFWVRFLTGGGTCGTGRRDYALSLGCFVLSSFCKPSCMTFPLLAATIDFFIVRPSGRAGVSSVGTPAGVGAGERCVWNWRPYALPAAYAAAVAVVAQYAQSAGGATADLRATPLGYRVVNACVSYGVYLFNTMWPSGLAAQCEFRWPRPPRFLAPGLAIAFAAGLFIAWRAWRRRGDLARLRPIRDVPLACALFFSFAVFPFLGISNFGYHAYADRFTYVPSLAFGIGLAAAARHLRVAGRRVWHALFLFVLLAAAAGLGFLADRQTRVWRDDETLFSNTLDIDGDDNFTAHRNLAMYYYEFRHDLPRVIMHFERAKEIDAFHAGDIDLIYIIALLETGEKDRLGRELSWFVEWTHGEIEAIGKTMAPGETPVRTTTDLLLACASCAVAEEDYATAEKHLRTVRRVRPDSGFAYYIEGIMRDRQGDEKGREEAWSHLCDDKVEPYLRHRWVGARQGEAE